jgi:hypothetical protein
VAGSATPVVDTVVAVVPPTIEAVAPVVDDVDGTLLGAVAPITRTEPLIHTVGSTVERATDAATNLTEPVRSAITGAGTPLVGRALGDAVAPVLGSVTPVLDTVTDLAGPVVHAVIPVLDTVDTVVGSVADQTEPVLHVAASVVDGLPPVAPTVADLIGQGDDPAPSIVGPVAGPAPHVPGTVAPSTASAGVAAPVAMAAGEHAATPVVAFVAAAERIDGITAVGPTTTDSSMMTPDLSWMVLVPPVLNAGTSMSDAAGLPPAGRSGFTSGTSPADRGAISRRSGSDHRPVPSDPRQPLPGLASGSGGGTAGSSGGDGTFVAALLDRATAPAAPTLGGVFATERRITWWYPEIVVSPG